MQGSHKAVREWYQKGRELFEGSTEKKKRKWIAVDEKEIKLNGTTVFIWGAVDLDDEKVIGVWVSFGRSGLEAMIFLKKVKQACKGKLPRVFIDGGTSYPWALERVGFERHTILSFGLRSKPIIWQITIPDNLACMSQKSGRYPTVLTVSYSTIMWVN